MMENLVTSEPEVMRKKSETAGTVEVRTLEKAGNAGVCLSVACAAHCILTPLLLAVTPVAGAAFFLGEGMEIVLVVTVLAIAVACSCWGFRIHRKKRLVAAFATAAAFVVVGQFMADKVLETAFVALGGLGLVASHFLNAYLCKSCRQCGHAH